ncbi:MAG: sugar-binding domain-containing protein [Victivallales bacterium]
MIESGLLPKDIFYGLNIIGGQDATIGKFTWFYREFSVSPQWHDQYVNLCFTAVDYRCDVFVNGAYVGSHEGHFSSFELEVQDVLRSDAANHLLVKIYPFPPDRAETSRSQILKNQLTDCTPAVCTLGISDDVFLKMHRGIAITDVHVRTSLNDVMDEAKVEIAVELLTRKPTEAMIRIRLLDPLGGCLYSEEKPLNLRVGTTAEKQYISVKNPALWWPNGHGDQPLYHVEAEISINHEMSDLSGTTFGIRKVEWIRNSDEYAVPALLRINNMNIYIKGGGWPPIDLFYINDPVRYDYFLKMAKAANFNTIRWWGGGIPEPKTFYDLCDRYGLMVLHDFFLANDNYDNQKMYQMILQDGSDFVKKRRNHVCIVLWTTGNELESYRSSKAETLAAFVIASHDPDRMVSSSSPCSGMGEAHYITPYRYSIDDDYATANGTGIQLSTEGNCAAVANLSCIHRIIPPEEINHFNPDKPSDSWIAHNVYSNWGYAKWNWLDHAGTHTLFGDIQELSMYVEAAQFSRAQIMAYGVEEFRRQKYDKTGTSVWQFIEAWPNAAGNCIIDWYGAPKYSYWFLKKAYEKVHVSLRMNRIKWKPGEWFEAELHCTNDTHETLPDIRVSAKMIDGNGRILYTLRQMVTIPDDASICCESLRWQIPVDFDDVWLIFCEITDGNGRIYSQSQYYCTAHSSTKHCFRRLLSWPATTLTVEKRPVNHYEWDVVIRNKCQYPALFCHLDGDRADYAFIDIQDNEFSILPHGERTVRIQSEETKHLTMWMESLRVSCWNLKSRRDEI